MARIDHPDPAAANAAGAARARERRERPRARVRRRGRRLWLRACRRTSARSRASLDGVDLDAGVAVELDLTPQAGRRHRRGAGQAAGSVAAGELPSHRPRSARRHGDGGGGAARPWSEEAPHFARRLAALGPRRFSRPVRRRRRARHPQCRRLGGAGTGLRARGRARLSARARSGRRRARCGAAHDLFPPLPPMPISSSPSRNSARCENCGRASRRPAGSRRRRPSSRPRPRGA